MTSHRKKPTAGFWITVALVAMLMLYPFSYGPAFLLYQKGVLPGWSLKVFHPVIWRAKSGPTPIRKTLVWSIQIWLGK
jgi:hypothetical protein